MDFNPRLLFSFFFFMLSLFSGWFCIDFIWFDLELFKNLKLNFRLQEKEGRVGITVSSITTGGTVCGQRSCLFLGIHMWIQATFCFPFPVLRNFPMELLFRENPVVVFPMVVFLLILQVINRFKFLSHLILIILHWRKIWVGSYDIMHCAARHLGVKSPIPYSIRDKVGLKRLKESGINFAFGGTGVFDTSVPLPNMTTQIDFFQQLRLVESVVTNGDAQHSVALVSVSGNDYSFFLANNGSSQVSISIISNSTIFNIFIIISPLPQ